MDILRSYIQTASDFLWGFPLIILLVGTGFWLTFNLRGIQFTRLWHALYLALIKRKEDGDEPGDITHFQALMTALSATVGTGNIAGVATAIAVGGPGALFWMWITGLVGMATKYSEAVLAVKYREVDEYGTMSGGPMYYISKGLNAKWLGALFAFFAAIAAFGIGNMVQSNSVADALESSFNLPYWQTGIILTIATALVIIGGIKNIGRVAGVLVPIMIVLYMGAALIIIFMHISLIPAAFEMIIVYAFTPKAGLGGFLGATVMLTVRMGVARGVFSNESGLGSSPIAAAAAKTKHPVSQALVSMTQTFIDTIVVCTMTGLVLIISGEWSSGLTGARLTTVAFTTGIGSVAGEYIVSIGLALFAYSTILGWSYYGEKSIEYLLGIKAVKPYRYIFTVFVFVGAVAELETVWSIADLFNALMAFPNLVGLLVLTPVIVKVTKEYFDQGLGGSDKSFMKSEKK
ncbi:MAG: sodium:alanine symporter family protein [Calditrichia bacterium]|jgi:AGCS family alanine or glycine:cation symporter|nr:sodium:alanine symporter family protein [Calditrichia bacterium]